MYLSKICLGTSEAFGISLKEQIKLFADTGFDGYFLNWHKDLNVKELKVYGDDCGIVLQSIHAPFLKSADMWKNDDLAVAATEELIACLRDCAENEVPLMVCHAFIGFEEHSPNVIGIENYRKVVDCAKKLGVCIAFENTEGEEYLQALMQAFQNETNVGFCWDTGHEMCYNYSRDMMALYGDKLVCTHLNDNLGISSNDGKIFWTDDLHLLPFDGGADWSFIVDRLNRYHYNDFLTFELVKQSKPNRHENDCYDKMTVEEYVCEAYKRACRVAMKKQQRGKNDEQNKTK